MDKRLLRCFASHNYIRAYFKVDLQYLDYSTYIHIGIQLFTINDILTIDCSKLSSLLYIKINYICLICINRLYLAKSNVCVFKTNVYF